MKKIIYGIVGMIVFLSVVLVVLSLSGHTPSIPLFLFSPTPTPIVVANKPASNAFRVQQADPKNHTSNVSLDKQIVLTLSKPVPTVSNIDVWVYPEFSFSVEAEGNSITIKPTSSLVPGTLYAYAIKLPDGTISPVSYFSTSGEGPITNPNYDVSRQITTSLNKHFYPGLFLANLLPQSTPTYYASSAFTQDSPAKRYFRVLLLGNTASGKQDFLTWLEGLGLSTEQINALDLRYEPLNQEKQPITP